MPPTQHTPDGLDGLTGRLADDRDGAFPELVDVMHGRVFSGVVRLTGHKADAEDITQDTFIRAYRALGRYPQDRIRDLRLEGWVWTIALNLCRNRARDTARRPALTPLEGRPDPSAPDSTEDAAIESVDDVWDRRLGELPDEMRRAVVLRHVVGLSYREIAAATGRPPGTVKSDVHRGIERLHQILTREGATT